MEKSKACLGRLDIEHSLLPLPLRTQHPQQQLQLAPRGTYTLLARVERAVHLESRADEVREGRRVYTDDSDLFLCALHSGWVSWSAARRARREGRDLVMEVRLTREARYIGGYGQPLTAKARERGDEELGAEDDGTSLLSSGWGNGYDGAGLEVLRAEFVPVSFIRRRTSGGIIANPPG